MTDSGGIQGDAGTPPTPMQTLEQRLAAMTAERDAALAREAAVGEVLAAIGAMNGDPQPVFDTMLRKAHALCDAESGALTLLEGDQVRIIAAHGLPPEVMALLRTPSPAAGTVRALAAGQRCIHIPDMRAVDWPEESVINRALVRHTPTRTRLTVPMRRNGVMIGQFSANRPEVHPFSEHEIALLESFAAQAVIALENARLLTEQRQALDQQTATAEVLAVINANQGNLAPVFDAILERAHRLCGAEIGSVGLYDGAFFRKVARIGYDPEFDDFISRPYAAAPQHAPLLRGETINVADVRSLGWHAAANAVLERTSQRAWLEVPMVKDGVLLGTISAWRRSTRQFTDDQAALLRSFADQAVIALENARLLTEQREALERQTATAELLQVINASPGNVNSVFETILQKAHALCAAEVGALFLFADQSAAAVATHGYPAAVAAILEQPRPASDRMLALLAEGRPHQTLDMQAEQHAAGARDAVLTAFGVRTRLVVPLHDEGRLLGFITASRLQVRAFTDPEIRLLENFAAQAVIAMQNARLLAEQHEALERQTATAEVLQVINASPGDLAPVFDAVLEKAMRLCGADFGNFLVRDSGFLRLAAARGLPPAYREALEATPQPIDGPSFAARALRECQTVNIADFRDTESYREGMPLAKAAVNLGAVRSICWVPLVHEDTAIGLIVVFRQQLAPFTMKAIELLETFAAQAAIAMQNARLLGELRESLEYQGAISGLLRIVSSSLGELAPVFDGILERAHVLCGAEQGSLQLWDGSMMRAVAVRGIPEEVAAHQRAGYVPASQFLGQLAHIPDVRELLATAPEQPVLRIVAEATGLRTLLSVPLLKDGKVLGRIVAGRREVRPFDPKHIDLLQTFADQAVLAIENARLVEDLRTRTAELATRNDAYGEQVAHQSATIDVLKAMSSSPDDPQPVFELIAKRAQEICAGDSVVMFQFDGSLIHFRYIALGPDEHAPQMLDALRRAYPMQPSRLTMSGRAILERQILHVRDMEADAEIHPTIQALGYRSQLALPLLRGEVPVGAILLNARKPGGFSDRQLELMRTFSEQAVIAIDSAETYRALQERTAALAKRNQEFSEQITHQAATIDVLKVMSSSAGDTRPVFDIILRHAMELCGCAFGNFHEYDGELLHLRSHAGWSETAVRNYAAAFPRPPDRQFTSGRTVVERRTVHFSNVDDESGLAQAVLDMGVKSVVAVPLLRDDEPIGAIALGRIDPGGFSQQQIDLLQTFAEQAVIAIGSAATLQALQKRTEELARSVSELQALEEVSRAVNASLELDTVLATIIARSVTLARADEGTIYEYDATTDVFIPKAAQGMTEERIAALRDRQVRLGETHLGRAAAEGRVVHVPDVQQDPSLAGDSSGILAGIHAVLAVPLLREGKVLGGLVIRRRSPGEFEPGTVTLLQTFAAQCVLAIENAHLFEESRRARAAAEAALSDLRRTQDRLVQTEKLASLGQLTAGIAHEIKNPLNFVNNFSDLSAELLEELRAAMAPERVALDAALREEIDDLTATLKGNLDKIAQHGRRADSIVKNMLLHSRGGEGEARPTDVNALAAEALNLAFHGARAAKSDFNVTLEQDLDPAAGIAELYPQEITRVLLNLVGNGFYAARKKMADVGPGFAPTLRLSTRDLDDAVEIRVRDNGAGIPPDVRERIFQPFFTTKPAGEGTGLGLSLSHDIVVKQHGGEIDVDSTPGEYTEFRVVLPRRVGKRTGGTHGGDGT